MTTTLDPATLPCPEGWRWERGVLGAALCSPDAPRGMWSVAVSARARGWDGLVAPHAPASLNYKYLSPLYPTPIAAARAALIALADAGHPEAAALRAAAGEAPSGPTRGQIAALLRAIGDAGYEGDCPITIAYDPHRDPFEDQPTDGWVIEIDDTTHHGPAALDALVRLIGDDHE